jgi:quinol monooxygenase YgiN
MKFIQIIEYTTSKPEEAQKALDTYLAASEGKRSNSRGTTASDRDNPNVYVNVVEFPSYEAAQKNSELPETQALAEAMMKICDGPPTFRNLDVLFESS